MILTGPTQANVAPAPPPTPPPPPPVKIPQLTAFSIQVDLVQHTFTIAVGGAAGSSRTVAGSLPPGFQLALQAFIQSAIETDQGWAPGSSMVAAP